MILQFDTQDEIVKKLRAIARVHRFDLARTISIVFYDVFKIAYYALDRKTLGIAQSNIDVTLSSNEITKLVKLVHYYHSQSKIFPVELDSELTSCFGPTFSENDAVEFFEKNLQGRTITDRFRRQILIPGESIKFMYKDHETGEHKKESRYYQPQRGKRLPWISHTLQTTSNIYSRTDGSDQELMYLNRYDLKNLAGEGSKCFWVVIAKRYKKDKVGPFRLKTAFPIFKINDFLRRVERYRPVDPA